MELKRAEFATVGGVPCDLLDSTGRLLVTPNPITLEGQTNVPAELRDGESLGDFLERHVPGIRSGAWTVSIGGYAVPQAMWKRTYPKHGQFIACRASVGKQVVTLIAIAVLAFFTMGAGFALLAPALAGTMMGSIVGMGLFVVGSMLINKVLGPKPPKAANNPDARATYSLSNQRNNVRAYEPIPVLWGEMRVSPDLASLPYTWYEGEDQYLSTILLGGINVHSYADLRIGETAIATYEAVTLYPNGFSGVDNVAVPLFSNADTVAGAELVNGGPYITRTTSTNTSHIQVDIEGQLMDVGNKGQHLINTVSLHIETRPLSGSWTTQAVVSISNSNQDTLRRSYTYAVGLGQYEVRVKLGVPTWNEGGNNDVCKFAWTTLKSIQPDSTDYSQWGRLGIKIKATGQLSGNLDTLNVTYVARPMPIWNGTAWVTATSRATGLSNPGAVILQALRGVYSGGILQFGLGLSDEQIDIEGLKAFMLQCTAKGYTYDRWITTTTSLGAFFDEVALAGMGQFSWTDGSRPTVVFVGSAQPISAVINMANMVKGSFSVAYNLSNSADGIEYQYLDRNRNWETQTLRVMAPGITTMLNPARITGDGITTEAHAAVMARYHLAQSLYQYKTIDFGADIEHLDYRRLSVLSLSHDMTQWGFGGRVMAAQTLAGKVVLTLDEPVPALPTRYVGLRVPGSRDYRVFGVEAFTGPSDTITLVGAWPAGVAFPGGTLTNPAHDTLWCYDFKATPGYRVRVVSITPEADMKGAGVSCVPEGPEFWDYVMNGSYVPAPHQSSLPELGRCAVTNLRVSEQVHLQGDTEWYELHALWDVEGEYDHAQVWAGRDGSELRLVDANAVGTRSSFRIENGGQWLIEVRPFNAVGVSGQMGAVLYITIGTDIVLRNVENFAIQTVEGGLRRFAWGYTGTRPNTFAGVQIRYLPGNIALNEAMWDAMTPLGELEDTYTAQFETTKPAAGEWTFGIRAIDTSGRLASGVVRNHVVLDPVTIGVIQVDLTPPPAPTNVTISPAMTTATATWDAPTYNVGRGHENSLVSVALKVTGQPLPVFADAVLVASPEGAPASISVEMGGVSYRAWVQHVSKDGGVSLPSSPVDFVTGVDPAKILGVLAGQITSSELHTTLGTRIDLIDGPASLAGSVAKRLADEALARGDAITAQNVTINDLQADVSIIDGVATSASNSVNALANTVNHATTGLAATATNATQALSKATAADGKADAQAGQISTLSATVTSNNTTLTTAVQTESTVRASETGDLYAKYTVKVDVAGLVSGYGLASTANNAAPTSSFGVRANSFFIAPPSVAQSTAPTADLYDGFVWLDTSVTPNVTRYRSGAAWVLTPPVLPFVVQATPTTVNGQSVPAGVYANDLYVKNGTITNLKIGKLAVDDGHIANLSVTKLNAGTLKVGGYISSTNYVAGTDGWRINADGSAEFSGATVRGSLKVGAQIKSFDYAVGSSGWAINGDGTAEFAAASIRGKLTAAQIDTRGLDIKDAAGNVIFSSGSSLKTQIANNLPKGLKTNLLDPSTWVEREHGAHPGFNMNGGYFEQYITRTEMPDGSRGAGWLTYPGLYYNNAYGWDGTRPEGVPAGDADGGWNTDPIPVDADKSYRFAVWVKRETGAAGSFFFGCTDVVNIPSGDVNINPYFVAGVPITALVIGRWYLAIGYVNAASSVASGQSGKSGLYDGVTGAQIHAGTDFAWAPGTVTTTHRTYHYYAAAQSQIMFTGPRLEQITGAEPSLAELLSMSAVSGRNPITAGNASTYIANLAVTHLQLAGGATSVHNVLGFSGGTGTLATGTIGMPANGVIEFAGGYRLSPPAEFYSASQRSAFNCNISVVVYKNGTHIGTVAAYGSAVNGPWVGFNQQYGSSVGDFTGKISGAINVAATISDVFSFRVDCSSTINISGSIYNAGNCFEGVLHVSGVYK